MIFTNTLNLIYNIFNNYIQTIYDKIIFIPQKLNVAEYQSHSMSSNYKSERIPSSHYNILDACLYNSYSVPSYKDLIFLYSHGHRDTIHSVIDTSTIKYLSKYGSVFIYDYQGYGKSTGYPSEFRTYDDILAVWNFLIIKKKIQPSNIILFGHSIGGSITTYLMHHLLKNNRNIPKTMILQNTFISINHLLNEWIPYSGWIVRSIFDTKHYIRDIDRMTTNINIYFIHGKDNKLVNINHSIDMYRSISYNARNIISLAGSHTDLIYDSSADEMFCIIYGMYAKCHATI